MTIAITTDRLGVRFGDVTALDDVTLDIPAGSITGILGRNGAGKSTLLSTIAAWRRPTSGTVRLNGIDPYEHARLMADTCLVRQDAEVDGSTSVDDTLQVAAALRPRWDAAFAARLVDRYELTPKTKLDALSTGKRAALNVTIGLASRARLTIFDEPQLGMDAPSRYAFYEELLADYAEHPRTILLSTHLIDEVTSLLEHVVIIDRGRLLLHRPVDDVQDIGVELTGPADAVDAMTVGHAVHGERRLGRTRSVVVFERIDDHQRTRIRAAGVEIGPLSLQDAFVHLTADTADTADTTNTTNTTNEEALR